MRAILIIAYRRADALAKILDICLLSGIENLFIHVDGPKDLSAVRDVEEVTRVAHDFSKNKNLTVRLLTQTENFGCAVSLIKAVDSAFSHVDELIVLEDDCIPSSDFWSFSDQAFKIMNLDSSIALFCGPQFGPTNVLHSNWFLSSYPFHWGWGTNSERWQDVRKGIASPAALTTSLMNSRSESRYWNAGCQRALRGYTDVWDTLFVREMRRLDLKALLPPQNLIRNLGNDEIALHTSEDSSWTNYKIGSYQIQKVKPELNSSFDKWARDQYFNISRRHLFSTRMTFLLDKFKRKKYQASLLERLEADSVNFL
jgi:hypothetical protein